MELDGQALELGRRKATALLAYIAVTNQAHRRDTLATLLWPEFDQPQARGALRRTLSTLNKALNGEWLAISRESVSLKRQQNLWIDVEQFRQMCHIEPGTRSASAEDLSRLVEAINLYRADFLAGFTLRDSPTFDEWQFFEAKIYAIP